MIVIRLEDLKRYRADRIAHGNCDHDEMEALAWFIDNADTTDVVECHECRYCKERGTHDCPSGYGYLYCTIRRSITEEDGYCYKGEPR